MASCLPDEPSPTITQIEPLRIQLSQAAQEFQPDIQSCANQITGISLIIEILPTKELSIKSSDLVIRYGYRKPGEEFAFVLRNNAIQFYIHPENPFNSIILEDLISILTGKFQNWSMLDTKNQEDPIYDHDILLIRLGTDKEIENYLENYLLLKNGLHIDYFDSLSISNQFSTIEQNPGSLGFSIQVPSTFNLKKLSVFDEINKDNINLEIPMLALTNQQPSGILRELLLCLQSIY